MSLLMKKRQQNSQRMNGLNDVFMKPETQNSQNKSTSDWPPMERYTSYPAYNPSVAQPRPIYKQNPSSKFIEVENPMKSLLQQSSLHQSMRNSRKMNQVPGWSIPATAQTTDSSMPYEDMSYGEPMDKFQPEAYYEAPAVYIDGTTGKEIPAAEFEKTYQVDPTSMNNTPLNSTASNAQLNLGQQNRCINANCTKCNNSVQAK